MAGKAPEIEIPQLPENEWQSSLLVGTLSYATK